MSQALTTYAASSNNYREQEIQAMSQEELILFTYRLGVRAVRKKDRTMSIRVLTELVNGLNFEAGDIAGKLLTLYDYMIRQVREGNFEEVETMLSDLLATWEKALGTKVEAA